MSMEALVTPVARLPGRPHRRSHPPGPVGGYLALYHQPSFARHLDAHHIPWRWYSFDPGTLRLADAHYLTGHHQRFGYFSKTGLPWKTILDISCNPKIPSFLEDAAAGTLQSVSWIDPAFTNFNPLGFPVNDDHPMADIKDGQDLVLAVYDALAASPQWDRSLLVIAYDEHGGFYDHVPPPQAADDEPETFGSYGVRVPAITVSPWLEPRTVSHTVFDHTSIIKTILLRFCPEALHEQQPAKGRRPRLGPQNPGLRVAQASHLGELLTRTAPRRAPSRDALAAASRGAGRAGHRRARDRRSSAQRPAAKDPCRNTGAQKSGAPAERAIGPAPLGKDTANDLIDTNHPGGAAGGGRRSPGLRGRSTAR